MGNLILNWAVNHQQYIYGIIIGYALGHIPQFVAMIFHLAMKIPLLRSAITSNPAKAKEIIDSIAKELDKDIDEEASQGNKSSTP